MRLGLGRVLQPVYRVIRSKWEFLLVFGFRFGAGTVILAVDFRPEYFNDVECGHEDLQDGGFFLL